MALGWSYDVLALGAAACWALTGLISAPASRHLGAFAFTRWRMALVALMLAPVALANGGLGRLGASDWGWLAVSGLVGIFVGDTALFASMNRLGPRRAGVLFATHALFSALLGALFLYERMSAQALLGAVLVVGGVMAAIALGAHKNEHHALERLNGSVLAGIGLGLGLLAAVCQASGAWLAKPVMATGADPVAATLVRVAVTAAAHGLLRGVRVDAARALHPWNARVLGQVAFSGFLGMGVGMSLLLAALRWGDLGLVGVLSSVSPVLVLPLLWWHVGRAPARGAWVGAGLTVAGTAMVLLR